MADYKELKERLVQSALDYHELLLEAADAIETLEEAWSSILERNIQLNKEVAELKEELRRATCVRCPDKGKCTGCNIETKYGGYDGEH